MIGTSVVLLEFDPELNALGKDKSLRDGLSVTVQIGDTLWVTNDETISLERLSLVAGGIPAPTDMAAVIRNSRSMTTFDCQFRLVIVLTWKRSM